MKEKDHTENSSRPSLIWLMTEGSRAMFEYSSLCPYKLIKYSETPGDGHSVLVLPGFMATDYSTRPLRKFITKLGYDAHGWDLGRNYGSEAFLEPIEEIVESLHVKSGQKVSIIGWSLGGVYARQIAKKIPHKVRQVITLGSPFRGLELPNNAEWIYKFITNGRTTKDVDPLIMNDLPNPAPVPTTAIYSKEDGVVPWQTCLEKNETEIHQNIQVRGSHFGLGFNPSVVEIISDRLMYSEENWVKFQSSNRMEELLFYPSL